MCCCCLKINFISLGTTTCIPHPSCNKTKENGDTINVLFTVIDVTKQCSQVQLQKLYLTMLVQSLWCQRCFYHYTLALESIKKNVIFVPPHFNPVMSSSYKVSQDMV